MNPSDQSDGFTSKRREELFVRLAKRKDAATAQEIFDEGVRQGDSVTIEAYHNLGRRLVHRGVLLADKTERHTKYKLSDRGEDQWLDEDQIATIVNPDLAAGFLPARLPDDCSNTSRQKCLAMVKKLRPALVLMDVAMPLLNGLQATCQILKAFPATKFSYFQRTVMKRMLSRRSNLARRVISLSQPPLTMCAPRFGKSTRGTHFSARPFHAICTSRIEKSRWIE
ncbi:MAG TPA: hypothetical protein VGH42_06020 [Verrucomicrobiae bacterium]|jgi:CheY-like chemotaxis protein